ncbi:MULTISPECIES: helix-turn-helix domain-containing protein [Komagataeibacter]|uniref:Helix-turn-helix transcriptional regulator n=1 Tax=Komagataeibacter oboediens TaxID=65958 RepID=A0ABS5SR01_9PROT|nr:MULTISPECIES: helix-turn-helix transcriptional regulator [Komagataeibacter]MBL7233356.1 helix-turn-helix transcriptional regulator [Komagataeibacter oboediens]MBT0676658.1 helix-turn-helix transcriptional regulator [Komagataeibacter oboediens]MBT0678183.1 helix-turn-helix transcriptional regulator [Komagataeibacter oboediens]
MTKDTPGHRIRTLREQKGMTQAALAVEFGISRSHLTKIETGGDMPGRQTLMAASTFFGVSLDWLANGTGDPRPAEATNEKEALLLFAYRNLPEDEAEAYLHLMLKRSKRDS